MNKLKRLFSPRALATTIGTAMLLHATVTVLAACTEPSAWIWCVDGGNTSCAKYCTPTGEHAPRCSETYWCCGPTDTCGAYDPNCGGLYGCGFCCQ